MSFPDDRRTELGEFWQRLYAAIQGRGAAPVRPELADAFLKDWAAYQADAKAMFLHASYSHWLELANQWAARAGVAPLAPRSDAVTEAVAPSLGAAAEKLLGLAFASIVVLVLLRGKR